MSKQDRQGVRTPTDIERKYDLGQLSAVRGLSAKQEALLNQMAQALSQYMNTTNNALAELTQKCNALFSPTVEVKAVEGGYEIKITDATGEHSYTIHSGEKGDPFTYEDFTPEQLEALRAGIADLYKLLHISADGTSLGVGGVPDATLRGYADILLIALFRQGVYLPNEMSIYGQRKDNLFRRLLHMSENNNTEIGKDGWYYGDGNTNIYGTKIEMFAKPKGKEVSFKPYYEAGDSFSITMRTSGFVTSSGKDVFFTVPLSRPIIGNPVVTIASGNGFTFRQNGNYTHGSTASNYVHPAAYAAAHISPNAIAVRATFSDVTNAINNETTGITWNGTITFE